MDFTAYNPFDIFSCSFPSSPPVSLVRKRFLFEDRHERDAQRPSKRVKSNVRPRRRASVSSQRTLELTQPVAAQRPLLVPQVFRFREELALYYGERDTYGVYDEHFNVELALSHAHIVSLALAPVPMDVDAPQVKKVACSFKLAQATWDEMCLAAGPSMHAGDFDRPTWDALCLAAGTSMHADDDEECDGPRFIPEDAQWLHRDDDTCDQSNVTGSRINKGKDREVVPIVASSSQGESEEVAGIGGDEGDAGIGAGHKVVAARAVGRRSAKQLTRGKKHNENGLSPAASSSAQGKRVAFADVSNIEPASSTSAAGPVPSSSVTRLYGALPLDLARKGSRHTRSCSIKVVKKVQKQNEVPQVVEETLAQTSNTANQSKENFDLRRPSPYIQGPELAPRKIFRRLVFFGPTRVTYPLYIYNVIMAHRFSRGGFDPPLSLLGLLDLEGYPPALDVVTACLLRQNMTPTFFTCSGISFPRAPPLPSVALLPRTPSSVSGPPFMLFQISLCSPRPSPPPTLVLLASIWSQFATPLLLMGLFPCPVLPALLLKPLPDMRCVP
ncbi:hypothetical protein B0H15DRAFT_1020509 [Mycena belliarum]|uniref:Uncharacterized protein n=1 Tax=Mycena belliarum TaxID=1033014 RepID=A0AAD6UDS7_9AGAR|nr:hypothetical protein B0H15DRAFT_1020509 [Mycena belliae]